MLKMLRKQMRDDKGFTLIELMVVVLIIAILLAIAIPTFLRVRRNAQDRAAQSSLQTALKAEKAFYTEGNEAFTEDGAVLEPIEGSIDYDGAVGDTCALGAGPKCVQVSLVGGNDQQVLLVAQSASGTYWALRDVATDANQANVGTFYGSGAAVPAPAAVAADEW